MDLVSRVRQSSMKMKFVLIAGVLVAVGAIASIAPHLDRETYRAFVTDKAVKIDVSRDEDGADVTSKYLIYTKLEDGAVRVFQNTDSLIEFKWNSSDIYGMLEKGKNYDIKTYGWRAPFLSMYENIIDVKEVAK
jgi:hypothetical protein